MLPRYLSFDLLVCVAFTAATFPCVNDGLNLWICVAGICMSASLLNTRDIAERLGWIVGVSLILYKISYLFDSAFTSRFADATIDDHVSDCMHWLS